MPVYFRILDLDDEIVIESEDEILLFWYYYIIHLFKKTSCRPRSIAQDPKAFPKAVEVSEWVTAV